MKKTPTAVSEYLAMIGKRGGLAKVATKGFASLTPEQRSERAKAAVKKRWDDKRAKDARVKAEAL
jgi:hypothetical protein